MSLRLRPVQSVVRCFSDASSGIDFFFFTVDHLSLGSVHLKWKRKKKAWARAKPSGK